MKDDGKSRITLPGSDFTAPPAPKDQTCALVYGDGGAGKTTFSLYYAPDPTAFLSFDRRGDHAAMRAATEGGRRILFARVDFPANLSKLDDVAARKMAQKALDHCMKNFDIAVEQSLKGNVRSIVLDTGTEFSEIVNILYRGRADKVKGDYGKSKDLINRQIWRLFHTAREGNANLIVLARAKAIWENNEPTGKFTYRAPDVMNDAADWSAHIRLKKVRAKDRGKSDARKVEIEVTKAGVDRSVLGDVYDEDSWGDLGPFVWLCLMNYPGTTPSDWE